MNNIAVGHHFNVNQSTAGYIQKRKMKCVDLYRRPLQMVTAAMKLRRLLLGRKVMTNRDSITLPTKVRLVKAMVFPVVMYRCESWTV